MPEEPATHDEPESAASQEPESPTAPTPTADTGTPNVADALPSTPPTPAEPAEVTDAARAQVDVPPPDGANAELPTDDSTETIAAPADAAPTTEARDPSAAAGEVADRPAAGDAAGEATAGAAQPAPPDNVEAAMQAMLDEAEGTGPKAEAAADAGEEVADATAPFDPPDFSGEARRLEASQIEMLDDVELDVKIELGRTDMYIEDVLALGTGSVVELNKTAGDPVDILVNDRLVARGEVLVLNDSFCVRINDIVSPIPELQGEK